jgi:hypothetical protein
MLFIFSSLVVDVVGCELLLPLWFELFDLSPNEQANDKVNRQIKINTIEQKSFFTRFYPPGAIGALF